MSKDWGFDLPDKRHTWVDTDGREVSLHIHRRWFDLDVPDTDGDTRDFAPSWVVKLDGKQDVHFPEHINEDKAIEIVHIMYDIDEKATAEIVESDTIHQMEMRAGA